MATITFAVHTFVGGRFVARPLLASKDLPEASKWLNYYCWHITTVMIAFIAAAFAWLAVTPGHASLIVFLSSLTAAVSVLSVVIAIKGHIHPLRLSSTSLFAMTSALGWTALFA
jgi:hypothetical protein